jgi:hypothetical protein
MDIGQHMTFTAASPTSKFVGGVKYNHITTSDVHYPRYIFHILHNHDTYHLLNILSRGEKVYFLITAFTTLGGIP